VETDGLIEELNTVFENYLQLYIKCIQDDQDRLLPQAELVRNNLGSETTSITLFFANAG
jgi:hypothetical protein